jgi:hypothetical protein
MFYVARVVVESAVLLDRSDSWYDDSMPSVVTAIFQVFKKTPYTEKQIKALSVELVCGDLWQKSTVTNTERTKIKPVYNRALGVPMQYGTYMIGERALYRVAGIHV